MEKISLFDPKTERYTKLGHDIANEISSLLEPFYQKYADMGVSMRDLHYIVESESTCSALSKVLQ